nr:ribosomal protein S subunit 13 [Haplopteris ensiformis]
VSYILGTKLVSNKQVRLALTQIFGIGPKKATWICDQLGLSDNTKVSNLTWHQINWISKIVRQKKKLVDSELKRDIQQKIKRLINISCYRGFRHKAGLPLRGQRTHSNAKTSRKLRISINQHKKKNNLRFLIRKNRGRQDTGKRTKPRERK